MLRQKGLMTYRRKKRTITLGGKKAARKEKRGAMGLKPDEICGKIF